MISYQDISYEIKTINRERVIVLYTKSSNDDSVYIFCQPLFNFPGGFRNFGIRLIAVSAFAIIASIIVSLILSYRIFQPINDIYKKFTKSLINDKDDHIRETERIMRYFDRYFINSFLSS